MEVKGFSSIKAKEPKIEMGAVIELLSSLC